MNDGDVNDGDGPDEMLLRLSPELRGGDDRTLWELAVRHVAHDLATLDAALDTPPRHLLLALARVPGKRAGIHPDEQASLHFAWERDRGETKWSFAGAYPHRERRRGAYAATVCVPQGTTRLAYVDIVVLWRPRLPWAPPEDTEMGRQLFRFRRDAGARWRFAGTREA